MKVLRKCKEKFNRNMWWQKELSKKKKKKGKNYCRHVFCNGDLRKLYVYNKIIDIS